MFRIKTKHIKEDMPQKNSRVNEKFGYLMLSGEDLRKQETNEESVLWPKAPLQKSSRRCINRVHTDLLQGHIQDKSCPPLCSPPPVWHQGD